MVVSNPIAKNTTFLSGFSLAIVIVSSGEYKALISAPSALSSDREPLLPGTLSISAKVQNITPSILAIAIASSMRLLGIIHTGQPGPWMKLIFSPTNCGKPNFIIL